MLTAGIVIPWITLNWGWRANFTAMAVVGLVWALVWLIVGAEGPIVGNGNGDDAGAGAERAAAVTARRLPYRVLPSDPTVLGVLVQNFMAFWGLALTLTWFPACLQKGLGFDALTSGRLFALLTLLNISIGLALSAWSQRLLARGARSRHGRASHSSRALIVGGVLVVALKLLPMPDMTKVILLSVGGGLTGVIFSLAPAMVGSVSPYAQRSAMLAILNSIASIASITGVLAPVVTGRLIQNAVGSAASGYEQGFALSGALLVFGGLVGLVWVNPEQSMARQAAIG